MSGMFAAAVLATVGCASARVVSRNADEGIVALADNSDSWPAYHRTKARKLIEEHVGPGYEIIEEKEVTVGYTTTQNSQVTSEPTFGTIPFLPAEKQTTLTTSTQTPQKEWQIHYRRRSTPSGTAGTGIPAPPSVSPTTTTVQTQYPAP